MRRITEDEQTAIDTVCQLISDYRTNLEAITLVKEESDVDPTTIEGETTTGYYVNTLVESRKVAQILLKHDYPIYKVLGEEPPKAMYDELADELGLAKVTSFDL